VSAQLVAVGAAAHATGATVLALGPHHPSTHGVLQVALTVEDDVVVTAEPVVGFMHRGPRSCSRSGTTASW
jgi:NADH-quinone oxidoreductase subunit D